MKDRFLSFYDAGIDALLVVKESRKNKAFLFACVGLFILYFVKAANMIGGRYLCYYIVGCVLLGIMMLCSVRKKPVCQRVHKPFFIVWILFGTVQLVSGLINGVEYLPEAGLILLVYPIIFLLWANWGIENAFRLLSKAALISFLIYLPVVTLFFPIEGAHYGGFFSNPNGAAQYLSIVLCCLLMENFSCESSETRFSRAGKVLLFGVCFSLLFYSNSRAGVLSSLIAFLTFMFFGILKADNKKDVVKKCAVLVCVSAVCVFCVSSILLLFRYIVLLLCGHIEFESGWLRNILSVNREIFNVFFIKSNVAGRTADSISAGRFSIWKVYAQNLNFFGHKPGNALYIPEHQTSFSTSHNFILQQAYDHGVFAGIVALVLNVFGGVLAIKYALCREGVYALMPVVVIVAFGVVSLFESPTLSVYYIILLYYYFMNGAVFFENKLGE